MVSMAASLGLGVHLFDLLGAVDQAGFLDNTMKDGYLVFSSDLDIYC